MICVIVLKQEIIIGERGSHQLIPLGYLTFKKVIFRNCADHAETVSGELTDFLKTHFHDSGRHIFHLLAPSSFKALNHESESCGSQLVHRKLFPHGTHSF